jgi:demethylmenaquinone methyltransferase/2-methoxy-6-polyprenyl-1,4-benzoquinol methylase
MSNAYYAPGEHRAEKVHDLFGRIARRYDLINDVQSFGMHRLWKRKLVNLSALRPGERALDVCSGTGDLAYALAERGGDVTGIDFSEEMLQVARNKNPTSKAQSPKFQLGDAQKLDFADAVFDVVTVGYGLRNLANWEIGLQEMVRVTKPGGRVLVLDFGKPANIVWRGIYFAYLRFAVPVMGLIFCGNAAAYAYVLESLIHYPAQVGVSAKMQELGLVNTRIVNLLGGAMSINYGKKPF